MRGLLNKQKNLTLIEDLLRIDLQCKQAKLRDKFCNFIWLLTHKNNWDKIIFDYYPEDTYQKILQDKNAIDKTNEALEFIEATPFNEVEKFIEKIELENTEKDKKESAFSIKKLALIVGYIYGFTELGCFLLSIKSPTQRLYGKIIN